MLKTLDETIAMQSEYLNIRLNAIQRLREQVVDIQNDSDREKLYMQLYDLYRPYRNDSAVWYLDQCRKIALRQGRKDKADRLAATISLMWSATGYYGEAEQVLKGIDSTRLSNITKGVYYHALQNLYNEMAFYTVHDDFRREWLQNAEHYRNEMLKYIPKDDDAYFRTREMQLLNKGNLHESMAINDAWMKTTQPGSHRFALVAFYRYMEYRARRDTTQMITWLQLSSVADVKNAVMDQGSLWELANLLYAMGDTERSYNYISYTSACSSKFGSKQRSSMMAALMSDIVKAYKLQNEHKTRQLYIALIGSSVLVIMLLVALMFIKRQRGQLNITLKRLSQRNKQMESANNRMKKANEQMSQLIGQLNVLNDKLEAGNRVKEEYVAHFMALCRLYLDKLDKLRNQMRNLLKQHRFDQLERLANSSEIKNAEYEEFYQQFDEAFLKLFPDFVTDFNRLLRSDERIEVKQPGHLTPTLRIFALVRLGIDDSAQIAEFLNYSVNTIYNYRAQTRNKAAVNRDEFEKLVKQL
ncbi:MAG: DUF6377 domain-containing protein [Prevotella sp.]